MQTRGCHDDMATTLRPGVRGAQRAGSSQGSQTKAQAMARRQSRTEWGLRKRTWRGERQEETGGDGESHHTSTSQKTVGDSRRPMDSIQPISWRAKTTAKTSRGRPGMAFGASRLVPAAARLRATYRQDIRRRSRSPASAAAGRTDGLQQPRRLTSWPQSPDIRLCWHTSVYAGVGIGAGARVVSELNKT